jgi:hypothetical protein
MSKFGEWASKKLGEYGLGGLDGLSKSDLGPLLVAYGLEKSGIGQPNIPKTGYQGKIPKYEAVRRQTQPMDTPLAGYTGRRPGQGGQRYFTDTIYAQKPKDQKVPTLEEAQAIVDDQAAALRVDNYHANDSTRRLDDALTAPPVETPPAQQLAAGGLAGMYSNDRLSPYARREEEKKMAAGGMATSPGQGYYLGGTTDGMADEVKANIDGKQEARLSDGEFVIPADVVSHLGNGNSDAGAKQLHSMMDNVRKERTGNVNQGKEIDPNQFMPGMAQGGIAQYADGGAIKRFNTGGTTDAVADDTAGTEDPSIGQQTGQESSLSNWAGEYVTDMLGKGQALSNQDYQAYTGPLTAGQSQLQDQAFTGIGGLQVPQNMGGNYTRRSFDANAQQQYMNPYLQGSLDPQLREARRQAEVSRIADAGRMTKAGAFGGSRQAIMEAEGMRNLMQNQQDIIAQGYNTAFQNAQNQFNTEQDRLINVQDKTNQYGKDILGLQADAGAIQRGITAEGIAADKAQFEEERDYPYKAIQFQQSLLQGLPLAAQSYQYSQPSDISAFTDALGTTEDILDVIKPEEEETTTTSNSSGV